MPAAVAAAAAELDGGGAVSARAWQELSVAVGPGPLAFLVDELQAGSDRG